MPTSFLTNREFLRAIPPEALNNFLVKALVTRLQELVDHPADSRSAFGARSAGERQGYPL